MRIAAATWNLKSTRYCLAMLLLAIPGGLARGDEVTPFPKQIQRGQIVGRLNLPADHLEVWRVDIPEGARNLVIKTWGGTGDCDLLERAGAHPTPDNYDRASLGITNNERIEIAAPTPGPNYVGLWARQAVTGLAVSMTYQITHSVDDLPRFMPGSAVFEGVGRIVINKPAPVPGVLRYTTDGSDPTETSPVAARPLVIRTETDISVRFFPKNGAPGPVAHAHYKVIPRGTVTSLESGVPVEHLAGLAGSFGLFKLTAPGGFDLVIQTSGGGGNTRLLVRRGQPPTATRYFKAANGIANQATVRLPSAATGDWYVAVQGLAPFQNCTLFYSLMNGPDLMVWPGSVQPYITTETFTPEMCEVQDGLIDAGTHRLLRFTTEVRNIGSGDLVVPDQATHPNLYEFEPCHGHYHFKNFASYSLLDLAGNAVVTGKKTSFCILDDSKWNPAGPPGKFVCSNQGISVGWADVYDSGLPAQWVVIDGVLPGDYLLEITVNPDNPDPEQVLPESNRSNNTTTVPVTIPPDSTTIAYEATRVLRHHASGVASIGRRRRP
jgi:hypothetical protein